MNREIKFRAWDNIESIWMLGYEHIGGFSMQGEVMVMGEYTRVLNMYPLTQPNDIVLTQFTGLKDKNGKEIYEGDILKFDLIGLDDEHPPENGLKGQVKCMNIGYLVFGGWNYEFCTNIEIIGNIFETPEIINQ